MSVYSPLRDGFRDLNQMLIDGQRFDAEHKLRMAESARKDALLQSQLKKEVDNAMLRRVKVEEARQLLSPQDFTLNSMLPTDVHSKASFDAMTTDDNSGWNHMNQYANDATMLVDGQSDGNSTIKLDQDGKVRIYRGDGTVVQPRGMDIPRLQQMQADHVLINMDRVKSLENELDANTRFIAENEEKVRAITDERGNPVISGQMMGPGSAVDIARLKSENNRVHNENNQIGGRISKAGGRKAMYSAHINDIIRWMNSLDPTDPNYNGLIQRGKYQIGRLENKIHGEEPKNNQLVTVEMPDGSLTKRTYSEAKKAGLNIVAGGELKFHDNEGRNYRLPPGKKSMKFALDNGLQPGHLSRGSDNDDPLKGINQIPNKFGANSVFANKNIVVKGERTKDGKLVRRSALREMQKRGISGDKVKTEIKRMINVGTVDNVDDAYGIIEEEFLKGDFSRFDPAIKQAKKLDETGRRGVSEHEERRLINKLPKGEREAAKAALDQSRKKPAVDQKYDKARNFDNFVEQEMRRAMPNAKVTPENIKRFKKNNRKALEEAFHQRINK